MLLLKSNLSNFLRFSALLLTSSLAIQTIEASSSDRRLAEASRRGNINKVKEALDAGADINNTTAGLTPLELAARNRHNNILKLLIDRKADLKKGDPVSQAAWYGNAYGISLLLAAGADFSPTREKQLYMINKAARHGYNDVIKQLLQSGMTPPTDEEMDQAEKEGELDTFSKRVIKKEIEKFKKYISTVRETLAQEAHGPDIDRLIQEMLNIAN